MPYGRSTAGQQQSRLLGIPLSLAPLKPTVQQYKSTRLMNILLVHNSVIPVLKYGGTERVIWYLGQELVKMGHKVTYLLPPGSSCPFAPVLHLQKDKMLMDQVPGNIDVIHFNFGPAEPITRPYLITMHGNVNHQQAFDQNVVFVSGNHAARHGSSSFVYNGLNWDDYGKPDLQKHHNYFHFLGDASWRVKNVKGAIAVIASTRNERLEVLGGTRLNLRMGFRLTLTPRARFRGQVGGEEKNRWLRGSKGLLFPVRWHEPFGLALTESLYFGCPVFGTPYGSLPEIVQEGTGYLSSSRSALAQAVENSEQFSRRHCHQYAVDCFNSRIMALEYLKKYEAVANGHPLNEHPPQLLEIQSEKFLPWEE